MGITRTRPVAGFPPSPRHGVVAVIEWQKSTFSSGSDGSSCVELAYGEGELLLRESDNPARILPVT
ncbi:DUF397 domain-containing protein, partial [Streptomyces sp. MBT62]|uniref:DUF397 domain-containing protein n=1 Tax=Streptomyces sp. MBT62 TaxID=2800410 RepID=UPI0027DE6072